VAKHTMCWSGSSLAQHTSIRIVVTLSDMSDHLSLLSSCSMSCCIGGMVQRMVMVMFVMLITVFTLTTLLMLALCML
jgi:hypothetical protein